MKREAIEDYVSAMVEQMLVGTDMELVDVEYVRERDWYLRVFLEKPGGIDLDDCQHISEQLSAKLDEEDPIEDNYFLEVSSPGLDRVLKKDKDLVRYKGRDVDVQLFAPLDGQKQFTGQLDVFDDTYIHCIVDGKDLAFTRKQIAQIRLHLDF